MEIPRVALVLGTSRYQQGGGINKYFEERIKRSAELYHKGKIKHILVSGDNSTKFYNEPAEMLDALKILSIKEEDVTMDFAGFRTLDSVVRSKEIFG